MSKHEVSNVVDERRCADDLHATPKPYLARRRHSSPTNKAGFETATKAGSSVVRAGAASPAAIVFTAQHSVSAQPLRSGQTTIPARCVFVIERLICRFKQPGTDAGPIAFTVSE